MSEKLIEACSRLYSLIGDDELLAKKILPKLIDLAVNLNIDLPENIHHQDSKEQFEYFEFFQSFSKLIEEKSFIQPKIIKPSEPDHHILIHLQQICQKKLKFSDLFKLVKKVSEDLKIPMKKREYQSKTSILNWFENKWEEIHENVDQIAIQILINK